MPPKDPIWVIVSANFAFLDILEFIATLGIKFAKRYR